jgi:hypothetical protein
MPRAILLFIIASLAVATSFAQTWEVGGTGGAAGYIGDFNPNQPLKFTNAAFGLFLKRNINGYFSVKFNYTHGTISGADSLSNNQQQHDRNLSFSTALDEFSMIGELNFLHYIPVVGKNKWTPFIFLGLSTVNYNPQATYNGVAYDLRELMTEGQTTPYKKSAIAIPYGAGIKYNFTGQWNFIVDLGYRDARTGYLDDVAGYYPDKASFTVPVASALSDRSGEKNGNYTGIYGTQRGNFRGSDTYMFLGFTISYTFLNEKCYRFN